MALGDKHRADLLNFADWPQSWARDEPDKVIGKDIAAALTPVMLHLIDQGLALNTLRRHRDNLYLLGAKTVDVMTQFPEIAPTTVNAAFEDLLDGCDYGSFPELRHATEAEQKAFEGTCRRVYKYLVAQQILPVTL